MDVNLVGTIPVRTYLKKYVHYVEHIKGGEALNLKNNSSISNFLMMLFTNKTNVKDTEQWSYEKLKKKFPSRLRFKVNSRMKAFNCFFMTRTSIVVINRQLEKRFVDFLLDRVRVGIQHGQSKEQVLRGVIDELDITFDVNYDTILKKVQRGQESKKMDGIIQQKRQARQNA